MPELPEVETMVRGIRPVMEGARLVELCSCHCSRKPMSIFPYETEFFQRVRNVVVMSIERRAKRIVWKLDSGDVIVFEPRMTGLALIGDPPSYEHLRYEFRLIWKKTNRSVWLWDRRGLGTLRLFTTDEFERGVGQVLGPDALVVSAEELFSRLHQTHREIKVALLDQKLIAGVGNLYASEILHEAMVHPRAVAAKLSKSRIQRIHTAMQRILLEAIEYEGSTLNDGTYRNALNKDGSYQNQHRVYAKAGIDCLTCGKSSIQRIVQAQRSTFFCPHCQRRYL